MIKCPECSRTAKNRCGMSSHIRTAHPNIFLDWTKDSVKSGSTKKNVKLNGDEERLTKARTYQRNWYRKNKMKGKEAPTQAPVSPLPVSNMSVNICPRCHCRFGTMIIEG